MKCNLEGCHRTFRKYAVFRNHIYDYHSNKLEDIARVDAVTPVTTCSTSTSHVDSTLGGEEEINDLDSDFTESISQNTCHFYVTSSCFMGAENTRSDRRI